MITSAANPKLKRINLLLKKSSERKKEGLFIIEGIKMFVEVLTQFPERITELYLTENALEKIGAELGPYISIPRYELVEESIFEKVSETVTPQGVLAVVKMPSYRLEDMLKDNDSKLLILDNLRDPGNLGTIIRTAEAAGMSGILMSSGCVDITNPKVVRSTMGAIFRMPFYISDNLPQTIEKLKRDFFGFKVYAAALGGSVLYTDLKYYGRAAIVIGNEANGVSDEVINASDKAIRIPMAGRVESLNAAIAAAVLMYEISKY